MAWLLFPCWSPLNLFLKTISFSTRTFEKHKIRKPSIDPQLLRSSLSSSSDLVSLSVFLWGAARQPDYYHDRDSCRRMIDVVARLHDRYPDVPSLVEQLKRVGCHMKSRTFLGLVRIYWVGGFYNLVIDVFEQLEILGLEPNTFARNILMDVLFKIGRPTDALQVLHWTEAPNFLSFNIALCQLCKAKDFRKCTYVLIGMIKKGFYPDPRTFQLVVDVLCKHSRLKEAYQVLSLMITLGISLSVDIWSILIDGFCRIKRFQMAVYLFKKMSLTGCSPNVVTYTSLIKAFLGSKMVGDAIHVLRHMEAKGCTRDLILCNVLIHGLGRNDRYAEAIGEFDRMPEIKLMPDRYTFSSLISTICLSRKVHIMPDLVRKHIIDADNMVFNSLLTFFCKANLPSLTVRLYRKMMIGLLPDKFSFVGLLNGLCHSGGLDEASSAYAGMLTSHPVLDNHGLTVIMRVLIRDGKCYEAINLFGRVFIDKCTLDSVSYTVAVNGLFKSGRGCEVMALFDQMTELGISLDRYAYVATMVGFCRNKDLKMKMQFQQKMIDAGIYLRCTDVANISSRFRDFGLRCCLLIDRVESRLVPSLTSEATSSSNIVVPAEVLTTPCSIHRNDFPEEDIFVEACSSEEILDMIAVG